MLHVHHSQSAQNYLETCSCFLTHPKPRHCILKGHCLVSTQLLRATGGSFPKMDVWEFQSEISAIQLPYSIWNLLAPNIPLSPELLHRTEVHNTIIYYVISWLDLITFTNLLLLKHTQVPLAWMENFQVLQPLASLAQTKELEHDPLPPTTQKADETSS